MKRLRKLWALAQSVYGKNKEEAVYSLIQFLYGKERIRELTEEEFANLMKELLSMLSVKECPQAPGEWRVIKLYQRKLGWSDEHLINFIRKVTGVSHPRFLDYRTSRAVIDALDKKMKKEGKCK